MKLTNREKQVMSLLCLGLKDRAIADTLALSVRTVQNHLSRIYLKFRAQNRTQAISRFLDIYGKLAFDLLSGETHEQNYSALERRQLCSFINGF